MDTRKYMTKIFRQELEKLQDAVGTFSDDIAMSIIKDELGSPEELFEFTPPTPIASASIGQVGIATTAQHATGSIVSQWVVEVSSCFYISLSIRCTRLD